MQNDGEAVFLFFSSPRTLLFLLAMPFIFACMLLQLPALHMHPYWEALRVLPHIQSISSLISFQKLPGRLAPPWLAGAKRQALSSKP